MKKMDPRPCLLQRANQQWSKNSPLLFFEYLKILKNEAILTIVGIQNPEKI